MGRGAARCRVTGTLALFAILVALVVQVQASPASSAHSSPGAIATVPVDFGPWNIAVNPATNRIYAVHKNLKKVTVIDGSTNAVITTISLPYPGASRAFGLAVNPATNRIYVSSKDDPEVIVIDGASSTVSGTILGVGVAEHIAVNPGTGRVYVAHHATPGVLVIDGPSGLVVVDVPLPSSPVGVAVNPSTNRLYASDIGVTYVIDTLTNQLVDTIPAGGFSVAVDSVTNRVYIQGLTVVDGENNQVIAAVPGAYGAVAVNAATGRVYTGNTGDEAAVIVDASFNGIVDTVLVGEQPEGVAINASTDRVYTANRFGDSVSVISDNGDADLDGVLNAADNCPNWPNPPQNLPAWAVPPGDPDCDGFSSANESTIGTLSFIPCDSTAIANDQNPDAWPPDFDDNKSVNITDVLALKPVFGTGVPPTSPRLDIQPGNGINIGDVLALKPFFNMSC
jgi:DNA-binding beta-propeller fold protein YncE